jgi:RNA ligase
MCRGLIKNSVGDIIHRPLPKFFNVGQEDEPIPEGVPRVYEKLDGSLGILYYLSDGTPQIATRGSFKSDQAIYANTYLLPPMLDYIKEFNRDYTYCFEIIYPDNQIIVDYKGANRLVLLAVIETATGKSIDIESINYPDKAKTHDLTLEKLKEVENKTDEGFVLLYPNGKRLKYKFENYKALHAVLSQTTNKTVWENLKNKTDEDKILELLPDEFYDWYMLVKSELLAQHEQRLKEILYVFKQIPKFDNDKDFATVVLAQHGNLAKHLFALNKGKDITQMIWDDIKPLKTELPKTINHTNN